MQARGAARDGMGAHTSALTATPGLPAFAAEIGVVGHIFARVRTANYSHAAKATLVVWLLIACT